MADLLRSRAERRRSSRGRARARRAVARAFWAGLGALTLAAGLRLVSTPPEPHGTAFALPRSALTDKLFVGSALAAEALEALARGEAGDAEAVLATGAPASAPKRDTSGLTRAQRLRGYSACMVPDPGFGGYSKWKNLSLGHVILPLQGGMAEDGGYDVVLHFHGHEAVRHGFVEVANGTVLAAVDLGVGSGVYEDTFARKELFPEILESLTQVLKKHSGDPRAHIRNLALSSWSAGYGAVVNILRHHAERVDAVVLLDSLHAGYVKGPPHDMSALHGVHVGSIAPIMPFAKQAALGEKVLLLTHSTVKPPGYAATGEVADFLLDALHLERAPREGTTPLGIRLRSEATLGGLSVKGYQGDDEVAHCAHVELLGHAVRDVLEPRWKTAPLGTSH